MKKIDYCVICGNKNIKKLWARFADFIIYYLFNGKDMHCNGLWCPECDYRGIDVRFDEEEIERLYWNYRGEYYNLIRILKEPTYGAIAPYVGSAEEIKLRKDSMREFFQGCIEYPRINSVLDYGGYKGEFVLEEFKNAKSYIYDISVDNGVNVDYLKNIDFVMANHVLEHASYPDKILKDIRRVSHRDTIIYLEVPCCGETWDGERIINEHINFFTIKAFKSLLHCNGFMETKIADKTMPLPWKKDFKIIQCLAIDTYRKKHIDF